jgi:hypothetical protein
LRARSCGFTQSSNLILRPFGDRTTFTEARLSVEEIEQPSTRRAAPARSTRRPQRSPPARSRSAISPQAT